MQQGLNPHNASHCPKADQATTLYVSDLDGTLLGSDSRLSATTIDILNRLITHHGLLFTVATARTPATVTPLMQQVEARLPYVVMSGAALWDCHHRTFSQVQVIPPDVERHVVELVRHRGVEPFVYRRHGTMLHAHHGTVLNPMEQVFVHQRQGLELKRFVLSDDPVPVSDDALLIFALDRYDKLEGVYHEIHDTVPCTAGFYHDIFDPQSGLLEVYRQGTSKAAAIARLAQQAGAQRVVAFGDNINDLPMLRAAHHAVAVGNAVAEIKAVAHEQIAPNTEHSVARWLLTHFTA